MEKLGPTRRNKKRKGYMPDFEGIEKKAVIFRASAKSNIAMADLYNELAKEMKKGEYIQIFDPNAIMGKNHIFAAYLNSALSFAEHKNKTKNIGMEMLLFVSFTDQIEKAIEIAGAKKTGNFILFCSNKKAYDKILSTNLVKCTKYAPTQDEKSNAMKIIKNDKMDEVDISRVLLNKMAKLKLNMK